MLKWENLEQVELGLNTANTCLNETILNTFNTILGHELRTPLTSIHGVLSLLKSGRLDSQTEEGQVLLELAVQSTNRLVRLAKMLEHESVPEITVWSTADLERLQLANDLYSALERQEILVFYQPIVSLITHKIIGFEALSRWYHPTKGVISPGVFIPIAEETGLIHRLGHWVLKQACHQLSTWQHQYPNHQPLTISVNLSGHQLLQKNLPSVVEQILCETGLNPHLLGLEITEGTLISNHAETTKVLANLKSLGIQLDIDDFGTGYSSFARLQSLPIDRLKLDRAFVSQKQWLVIEGIIRLASSLKLDVIVEGAETQEELLSLKQAGCQKAQGYLFSRPVSSQDAESLIVAQSNLSRSPL
ncbi:EAL domain-containing protein [Pantanalinema rosaneae CENA516]|uniref:putative bifunctional diguanylate cyclase/phosphodiesterase n=1 Tax=Pantanalinema rosaneae TaxID=1620701 RepID=UPI003D6E00A1